MSKYKIDYALRLDKFADDNYGKLYSPEGNKFVVVSNGFVNGHLLYDHKTRKVYGVCLKEVVGASDEYLEQCEGQWAKEQIPYCMSYDEAIKWVKEHEKEQ